MLTPGARARRTSDRCPSLSTSYSTTAIFAIIRCHSNIRSASSRTTLKPEFAADDHQLHLGRALADRQDPRVAVVTGNRVFVHEAVATKDLTGVFRVVDGCLAGDQLREAGLHLEWKPSIDAARGVVGCEPRRVHAGLHARDHERDVLVVTDGLTEHDPLLGVADGLLEASLCGT